VEIEYNIPIHSNPPPIVVSPPTEGPNTSYATYFLQILLFGLVALAVVGVFIYRKYTLREAVYGVISLFGILILFGVLYLLANKLSIMLYSGGIEPSPGNPPSYSTNNMVLVIISLLMGIIFAYFLIKIYERKEEKVEIKKSTVVTHIDKAIYKAKITGGVKSAILLAYKEMEKMMKEQGVEDKEYYTPREFREFALEKLRISEKPVNTLTNLFEIARYSKHEMTENHRKLAIEALEEIKNEIK